MGNTIQSQTVVIQNTQTIDILTLNGITYTVIVYDVISNPPLLDAVLDSKSMVNISNACLALFTEFKDDFTTLKSEFNEMILKLQPVVDNKSNVSEGNNIIKFTIVAVAVDSSAPSPQQIITPEINQTYVISGSNPDNFDFYVPDYFIQAQNDNKLNYEAFWSYLPNFELAFHKIDKVKEGDDSCNDSYECRDKCRHKKCRHKKCRHKKRKKKSTTISNLYLMLNNIYSTSRLVLLEQISPDEGIIRIEAIWKEFEKFEVKSRDNVKTLITDTESQTGSVSMRVKYRLKGCNDVILSMSISGTLVPNDDVRKRNLYFSVSTVPLSSEFDVSPEHAYNKSIAQFDNSHITQTCSLVLTPGDLLLEGPSEGPLVMISPSSTAPVVFIASLGTPPGDGGITHINVDGKVLKIQLINISNITLVVFINTVEILFKDVIADVFTKNLNKGDNIIYGYVYDGVDDFKMDFVSIIE